MKYVLKGNEQVMYDTNEGRLYGYLTFDDEKKMVFMTGTLRVYPMLPDNLVSVCPHGMWHEIITYEIQDGNIELTLQAVE